MSACPNLRPVPRLVRPAAEAALPTRFGDFRLAVFECLADGSEIAVATRGDLDGAEEVPVRIHSECLTGDVLGSLRCDCRDQLERALALIGSAKAGAVIYLPQEGRGIGLANKVRAYALQDGGLDTVDANLRLGFPEDARNYDVAAEILRTLGVRSVVLFTNNPRKVEALESNGVRVVRRVALAVEPNPHNAAYLRTKRDRCGHLI